MKTNLILSGSNQYLNTVKEGLAHLREPLFVHSYFILTSNILVSGLGFLFWVIVARFYDASDIGLAVALISSTGLVSSIARMGLDFSIIRFISHENDKKDLINTCFSIVSLVTVVTATLFLLTIDLWADELSFVRDSLGYSTAFIIFCMLASVSLIVTNIFIGLRTAKFSVLKYPMQR